MSENKINLVVPKDYNGKPIEVVLREGEAPVALDPKEPERVVISGTIDAPLRWLEKRVELINQKSTNIIVNRDKMGLALTIDETNYYQTGISGILQAFQKKCRNLALTRIRNGNLSSYPSSSRCTVLSSRINQKT